MRLYTPGQLMIDQLRDLSSTANQLVEAWPVLIELSTHAGLKSILTRHAQETRANVFTIHGILEDLHATGKEDRCQAMEGLLKGGENHLVEVPSAGMRDLMMLAHCSRIESYEIGAHAFTSYLAVKCRQDAVADALSVMLDQHTVVKRDLELLQDELFEVANRTDK